MGTFCSKNPQKNKRPPPVIQSPRVSNITIETLNIYFLWIKTKLKGSKGRVSVQIDQKQSKRRLFGHKMTSYVEIGVRYDKKLF